MTGAPIEALQRVPLFAELSRSEVKRIAGVFKERRFPVGETIIQQGSGGAAFFVIESGEAKVVIGGEVRATLKAGDHFGELALIDDEPRSATVVAKTDARVVAVDRRKFEFMVTETPYFALAVMKVLADRLRRTNARIRSN